MLITFFIFGPRFPMEARRQRKVRRNAVACVMSGWIKRTVIGDIVDTPACGENPVPSAVSPGKERMGLEVDAPSSSHVLAEFGQVRANTANRH